MASIQFNGLEFTLEAAGGGWTLLRGAGAVTATGLFPGADAAQARRRAEALVRTLFPVGVRIVAPDVAHPTTIGDLKIVPPDVAHPNFIPWEPAS